MHTKTFWYMLIALALMLALAQPALAGEEKPNKPERVPPSDIPIPAAEVAEATGQVIPDRYIVIFNGNAVSRDTEATLDSVKSTGGEIHFVYTAALNGFAATLPEKALEILKQDPAVAYIEPDQIVTVEPEPMAAVEAKRGAPDSTQLKPTWGLDRIDQRDLPLDSQYTYQNDATNVPVYVIDTGIRITHSQFEGRASYAYDSVQDGQNGNDCNGHGTHVAGIIGGKDYGVAKKVLLYTVRVLGCGGTGSVSQVLLPDRMLDNIL